jgi:hypothetical protein
MMNHEKKYFKYKKKYINNLIGGEDEAEILLEEKCSICLDNIYNNNNIVIINCNHMFHTECYKKTLNNKCPLCRKENIINSNWLKQITFTKVNDKIIKFSTCAQPVEKINDNLLKMFDINP